MSMISKMLRKKQQENNVEGIKIVYAKRLLNHGTNIRTLTWKYMYQEQNK